jgi:hypothetical protein
MSDFITCIKGYLFLQYTTPYDEISSDSTGSASRNRKHIKLPDIPHEHDKDEQYLLPQNSKDRLLLESQAYLSETGKMSMSVVPEEPPLKDDNELSEGTERKKLLENSRPDVSVTESGNDDYFVLQKTDDMDLK